MSRQEIKEGMEERRDKAKGGFVKSQTTAFERTKNQSDRFCRVIARSQSQNDEWDDAEQRIRESQGRKCRYY